MQGFFDNDGEIANKKFDKILDAIQNRNAGDLKKLFSNKSINETNDFDSSMDALFKFFKGKVTSYNDWSGPQVSQGKNDDGTGRNWKSLQSTYDVKTNEGQYRFAIKEYTLDTAVPDNIGICSLYIIKFEDSDQKLAYWGDGKWRSGIVIDRKKSNN